MLIAGAGEPGGLQLHSPEETEETVGPSEGGGNERETDEVQNQPFLTPFAEKSGFQRERESRTGICSHQIKLGRFILFPVVFGKEVVEKRDLRGGKD